MSLVLSITLVIVVTISTTGGEQLMRDIAGLLPRLMWCAGSMGATLLFQMVVNRCFFFVGPVGSQWLRYRFIYALYDYAMIISNTLIGIAVISIRFILWVVLGIFCMGRMDLCLIPGPGFLQTLDLGYNTYVALVLQDHRYNNPVNVVFYELLEATLAQSRQKRARLKLKRNLRLVAHLARSSQDKDGDTLAPATTSFLARVRAMRAGEDKQGTKVAQETQDLQDTQDTQDKVDKAMLQDNRQAEETQQVVQGVLNNGVDDDDDYAEWSNAHNADVPNPTDPSSAVRSCWQRVCALGVRVARWLSASWLCRTFRYAGSQPHPEGENDATDATHTKVRAFRRLPSFAYFRRPFKRRPKSTNSVDRRLRARNRWHLALMLHVNPGLRQYRGHFIKGQRERNQWWVSLNEEAKEAAKEEAEKNSIIRRIRHSLVPDRHSSIPIQGRASCATAPPTSYGTATTPLSPPAYASSATRPPPYAPATSAPSADDNFFSPMLTAMQSFIGGLLGDGATEGTATESATPQSKGRTGRERDPLLP